MYAKRGKIINVTSMKGGVGKTEVSLNLATAIKKKTGKQVVLIDFDIPYGGVSQALGLDKVISLSDWIRTKRQLTQEQVKNLVITKEGIDLIPAISSVFDIENFTVQDANRIIDQLQVYYDYIVIDSGVDLGETTQNALMKANEVVIVTTSANVSSWNNHQYKEDLIALGVPANNLNLFINQVPIRDRDIDINKVVDVYQNYGSRINTVCTAEYDPFVLKQRNKGELVYGKKSKCNFTEAIDQLTNALGIIDKAELMNQKSVGFFHAFKKVFG